MAALVLVGLGERWLEGRGFQTKEEDERGIPEGFGLEKELGIIIGVYLCALCVSLSSSSKEQRSSCHEEKR